MNCSLTRKEFRPDGIFSELHSEMGEELAITLEHAYPLLAAFVPKLPNGTYTCRRGMHRLHGMAEDFETFEITGVPGHTGMLFHCGNKNSDSDGCVLLGMDREGPMILKSRIAFAKFMELQKGVEEFQLIVT